MASRLGQIRDGLSKLLGDSSKTNLIHLKGVDIHIFTRYNSARTAPAATRWGEILYPQLPRPPALFDANQVDAQDVR